MNCEICNHLQPNDESPYRFVNLETLQSAASKGCRYCKFIIQAASHLQLDCPDSGIAFTLSPWPQSDYQINWHVSSENMKFIQIYTPVGHPPAWSGIPQGLELSPSPDSPQAYDFINARLRDCEANHPACKIPSPKPPTRLIDVSFSQEDPQTASHVRLVETISLPSANEVPYIALSYCWGMSQMVTTVRSNYQCMKQGFLVSCLPQTLQDAIDVTRKLNHRYLWVDALCIIQDDLGDWEVESSMMGTVYRNAYLTIAASVAASSTEGFLQSRSHAASQPNMQYQASWETIDSKGNPQKTIIIARILPYETHYPRYQVTLPIDKRGWTMQERMLSTRLLRYTAHELQWSCPTNLWSCECGSKEYPPPSVIDLEDASPETWQIWDGIVEQYNARLLTQYHDKLPAVSGMAKFFQDLTGSKYVAGLWVDNLVRNLMWFLEKSEEEATAAIGDYVAPSFSWASLGKNVTLRLHNEQHYPDARKFVPRADVEEAQAVLAGKNPLGRVLDGWIRLRGLVVKSVLMVSETPVELSTETRYSVDFKGINIRVCPDTILEEFDAIREDGTTERSVRRAQSGTKGTEKVSGSTVYLFFLGNFTTINPHKVQSISLDFLIIGLSPHDEKRGKYERIGYGYSEQILCGLLEEYVDLGDQMAVTIV